VLRVDVPEEDAESILSAYCPFCAEREFGASRAALLLHRADARGQRRAGTIAPSVRSKPT
jgi:hypothetical protein